MVVDSGWNRFGAHVHLMCSHGFHFLFKCSEKDLLFLLLTVRLVFVVAIFECMNGTPECITWTDRRTDGTIDSLSIFHGSDIQKCTMERTNEGLHADSHAENCRYFFFNMFKGQKKDIVNNDQSE